ncbi:hypothetical protein AB0F43_30990 [Kribbella sp. NPDC023972]|uniref:hypothetical protein n=1 Tax=Kribbella sp. NPDC023972 TaxID=3154795 RepID=UPI0033E7F850
MTAAAASAQVAWPDGLTGDDHDLVLPDRGRDDLHSQDVDRTTSPTSMSTWGRGGEPGAGRAARRAPLAGPVRDFQSDLEYADGPGTRPVPHTIRCTAATWPNRTAVILKALCW